MHEKKKLSKKSASQRVEALGRLAWTKTLKEGFLPGPLHGIYGSMEAQLEVQRTVKRAEPTAFLCLLKTVIGPIIKVHADHKGIIDWLR